MFMIQMLNSNDEWELCHWVFDSREAADTFITEHLHMFDDYMITEVKNYSKKMHLGVDNDL